MFHKPTSFDTEVVTSSQPITNANPDTLHHQAPAPYSASLNNTATYANPPPKPALTQSILWSCVVTGSG